MRAISIFSVEQNAYAETLEEFLKRERYEVEHVMRNMETKDNEFLIILMEKTFQFAEVCNYLLGLKNKDKKFIWLATTDSCSEEELYLLFKLGVCVHIVQNDNFSNLVISIKNIKKFWKKKLPVPFLNCSARSFVYNDEHVELTKKEYLLFEILHDNFGNTVTYNEIANKLWKDDKQIVKPKIANIIHGLRGKISVDSNISIKTVSTEGYKLLIK